MEKAWLRHFTDNFIFLSVVVGLTVLGAVTFFSSPMDLRADESREIQSTVVDVEVNIQAGNLADARQISQKLAFEKAVDQFLPTTMDAKIRAEKIKIAASYIKSFRVIDERQEGGILKSKVRCDLMGLTETVGDSSTQTLSRFEITWRTAATQLNSTEFLEYLKTNQKLAVDSFKMGRGIFWVNISSDRPAADIRTQMSQFLGGLYSVRLVENEASTTSTNTIQFSPNIVTTPTNSFEFPHTATNSLQFSPTTTNSLEFPKP